LTTGRLLNLGLEEWGPNFVSITGTDNDLVEINPSAYGTGSTNLIGYARFDYSYTASTTGLPNTNRLVANIVGIPTSTLVLQLTEFLGATGTYAQSASGFVAIGLFTTTSAPVQLTFDLFDFSRLDSSTVRFEIAISPQNPTVAGNVV
jgi:hypothetical protein